MNEMIQYIKKGNKVTVKDRHGNTVVKHTKKRGIMVAKPIGATIYVGWSLCNTNAGDRFNKYDAYVRAIDRAFCYENTVGTTKVPASMEGEFFTFVLRAKRYFKQCKIPQWVCDFYDFTFNDDYFDDMLSTPVTIDNIPKGFSINIKLDNKNFDEDTTYLIKNVKNTNRGGLQLP